ncbi:hypothetical protein RRG08_008038 [Elysia crispata]|uniref:Uncharacterized protein n=1 Tax=Elysia crispata TaxID=231223 RepID=A0AAE1DYR0_9GAST|nr:hypothetical protein RRG08_008038 [Elysia crispata]
MTGRACCGANKIGLFLLWLLCSRVESSTPRSGLIDPSHEPNDYHLNTSLKLDDNRSISGEYDYRHRIVCKLARNLRNFKLDLVESQ